MKLLQILTLTSLVLLPDSQAFSLTKVIEQPKNENVITDIFGNANGIAKCIITQVNGSVKKVTNDLDQLIHELEALNVPEKVIQQIEDLKNEVEEFVNDISSIQLSSLIDVLKAVRSVASSVQSKLRSLNPLIQSAGPIVADKINLFIQQAMVNTLGTVVSVANCVKPGTSPTAGSVLG